MDDIVNIEEHRRVNLDYDFKRIPTADGDFRPPVDMAEFERWRDTMENIRKRGERASLSKVRTAMSGVNLHGGEESSAERQMLRAIMQDLTGIYPAMSLVYRFRNAPWQHVSEFPSTL